jgi:hypothetical protein
VRVCGVLNGSKHWLILGAVLYAGAAVAQTPSQQAPPNGGRSQSAAPQAPPAGSPDEELIEFLGEDDHGDPAWSDMVKKAQQQPGAPNPQAPPSAQAPKQS